MENQTPRQIDPKTLGLAPSMLLLWTQAEEVCAQKVTRMKEAETIYLSENFRTHLGGFSARFDDYVLHNRGTVVKDRRNFEAKASHLGDRRRQLQFLIAEEEDKARNVYEVLRLETNAIFEMRSSLQNLTKLKLQKQSEIENISSSLHIQSAVLRSLTDGIIEQAEGYTLQKDFDMPEVAVWEQILGCKIAGTGRMGHLRVEFYSIRLSQQNDPNCFFIFRLTRDREYQVTTVHPPLPRDKLNAVVATANISRDFTFLLREVRKLFTTTCYIP